MDKGWKQAERQVARIVGGRRVPVSGRTRGDAPDIDHPRLAIEVKHRRKVPEWILDAMNQAEQSAILDQIPVVVLHESGQRYKQSLCVLRLEQLLRLLENCSNSDRATLPLGSDSAAEGP